jgi:hypothetical protein
MSKRREPWLIQFWTDPDVAEIVYILRTTTDPLVALRALARAQSHWDVFIAQAVEDCRGQGLSWSEIAVALGVTRQAAQKRFGGNAKGSLPSSSD